VNNNPHGKKSLRARRLARAVAVLGLAIAGDPAFAAEGDVGKAILQSNCGRCHAVSADAESPLKQAPNLFVVLGSFPGERLEFELSEGIGSRHRDMPQIQFSGEEISSIYYYLHGESPESELRRSD
jgi:mono/diheme cytochrome c family protein